MKFILVLFSIFALIFASVQAVDKSACSQPKEIGPCRKSDLQFFYNAETKACEQFFYGGCRGNDNRFNTQEECEQLCL
ncbi:hypothetical protein FF38_14330 [Lucilia cuprina]|uniref:BPTI/Kunitz inhibitor domain-containing protein n=1 Tax=Lucilia cuprina TaxID=7375 RepID=A0A0L0CFH8_LUCCU|nr:protease inhibitor [Lucilia cuprina]KAI8125571.1 Protease inhibitor [Lucilia cuprina]KNC31168.1 hypothetical protein FF38_14330 [Lucilia cuprina]